MTVSIRTADTEDIPAIIALLLDDARERETLNSHLWAVAPDAVARLTASLSTISTASAGPVRHHWLLAEKDGVLAAVAHGVNMPPPPIIDLDGGTAGVLVDDCHFPVDPSVSAPLLAAVERDMAEAGAMLFVAASPAGWEERTAFFAGRGYEATTLYMAKTGLEADEPSGEARPATAADLPGLVGLSAQHRALLRRLNGHFWNTHSEADQRFAVWMTMSLAMPDRSMFVSGPPDAIEGYIIAQPGSPVLLPASVDATRVGLIDDFYAPGFDSDGLGVRRADTAQALLTAAEGAFQGRGMDTVLAICPAGASAKAETLRAAGYATANLWMVKTSSSRVR